MFSQGQLIFASLFAIAFIITMVYVYRKDVSLHRLHYKGAFKVLIGFVVFIAILFVIKIFLKR